MELSIETRCQHLADDNVINNHYGAISFPIYQTATFAHPAVGESTGFDYSRLQNPTREHLEKIVASLEKGIDALSFSSGMAAISALMEIFRPGDHLIVDADLYGGSIRLFHNISEKNGITFTSVDCHKENVETFITDKTKAVFIETPTNPMMNAMADMNPFDAMELGIGQDDDIELNTSVGTIRVKANLTHSVKKGLVFMYQDYEHADVNRIIDWDHLDPYSGFPGYRTVRCSVEKA